MEECMIHRQPPATRTPTPPRSAVAIRLELADAVTAADHIRDTTSPGYTLAHTRIDRLLDELAAHPKDTP
jgi:hypothetical protein